MSVQAAALPDHEATVSNLCPFIQVTFFTSNKPALVSLPLPIISDDIKQLIFSQPGQLWLKYIGETLQKQLSHTGYPKPWTETQIAKVCAKSKCQDSV